METNKNRPINLDCYLLDSKHRYVTYSQGARELEMPYWTFVNLAKKARSTIELKKTCLCDMNVLFKYLAINNR